MDRGPPFAVAQKADRPGRRWFEWSGDVNAATLRADALAALLASVLVLPQAIAFAALAGLPPAWGLNAAIVCGAVAALAGSSRHVLTGPTNALSLALAASLAPLAVAGSGDYLRLALIVTAMVGAIQLAVALFRLGTLTHFVSPSVLLGFTSGAAVLIAWQGLKGVAGWPLALRWADMPWPAPQTAALATGGVTLLLALLLRRVWTHGPHMLLALVGGTLASVWLAGNGGGGGGAIERVGALPQALPQWQGALLAGGDAARPWSSLLAELLPIALALTIIALGQSIAIAKALAAKSGQNLDVNRECFGQGLANVAGALFSGFASCGSINRSLPHLQAGARTPLAGVMASVALLGIAVLAAEWIAWVPTAAIAALLLVVAVQLIDLPAWREAFRLDRREGAIAAGTAIATLLLPLEQAVLLGVAASLVLYLYRTAHPALRTMGFDKRPAEAAPGEIRPFVVLDPAHGDPRPECPQLKLLRMEGSVWFGAVAHVADTLRALRTSPTPAKHLLVMGKSMNFIDAAGARLWEDERRIRGDMGGALYFHRPRPEVLALWNKSGFVERLGASHLFHDKKSAIATIVPRLDGAICARCNARIFEECTRQPGAADRVQGQPARVDAPADGQHTGGTR